MEHISDTAKHIFDAASVAVALTTLAQWLPPVAALLSIIWSSLRIFEWFESRARKRKEGTNAN